MENVSEKDRDTTRQGRAIGPDAWNRICWAVRFRVLSFSLRSQSIFAKGNRLIVTLNRQTAKRLCRENCLIGVAVGDPTLGGKS